MNSENKLPSSEELWEMVKTFSQHADILKKTLETERAKNKDLNAENSGWLVVYQMLQSQVGVLEAEILRLRSWIEDHPRKS